MCAFFCLFVVNFTKTTMLRCSRGLMVKALDGGIVVHEFEPQSRYYVHFRTNNFRKGMKPRILPSMG